MDAYYTRECIVHHIMRYLQAAINTYKFLNFLEKGDKNTDSQKGGRNRGPRGGGARGGGTGRGRDRHACPLAAVPSYPYGITLLNCDGQSMTLGWKVPRFSGGSPILGYFVDQREAQHRSWREVNAAPVRERLLTVGFGGPLSLGDPTRWAGSCLRCPRAG